MTQITRIIIPEDQYEKTLKSLQSDTTPNHHRSSKNKINDSTSLPKSKGNGGDSVIDENVRSKNFISGDSENHEVSKTREDKIERIKITRREDEEKAERNLGILRGNGHEKVEIPSSSSPKRIISAENSPPSIPSPITDIPENRVEGEHWHPSPSAVPEVDALFSTDNPLIALAQSINMSFDPEKVNSGDFGELTDLFIKSAFFNNAAMIQQLPMLFGRSVRLTQFINQIEDDLFDPEKFKYLSANQKTALLAIVDRAQADITKGITRNSATIIQGMEALPKLAAFSEELHKKKVMEVPQDEDGKASAMMKMLKQAIAAKAGERKRVDDE